MTTTTPTTAPGSAYEITLDPGAVGVIRFTVNHTLPVDTVLTDLAPLEPPVDTLDGALTVRLPLTSAVAVTLRRMLAGVSGRIEPAAASVLRTAADHPHTPLVGIRRIYAGHTPVWFIQAPPHRDLVHALSAIPDLVAVDGGWTAPVAAIRDLRSIATTFGMHLDPTTPEAPPPVPTAGVDEPRTLARLTQPNQPTLPIPTTPTPPVVSAVVPTPAVKPEHVGEPLRYDGTIDGLRGVPVTDLAAVPTTGRGKQLPLTERFASIGITSVYDLLMTVPRRYLDRTATVPIAHLPIGQDVGIIATVKRVGAYDRVKRLVRHTIADDTGQVTITFFSSPWQAHRFRTGDTVAVWGKLDVWQTSGRPPQLQMTNPIMDPLGPHTALVVPIYPQSGKNAVTTWDLHNAAAEAARRLGPLLDPLPTDIRTELNLPDRATALRTVHLPERPADAETARRRLAFDEFLRMQLILGMDKRARANTGGTARHLTGTLTDPALNRLPYTLTSAQQTAITTIAADLTAPTPMHRLLQGDVGSGKTLVALWTALAGVESGSQAVILAPTEVLAWQLYQDTLTFVNGLTIDGKPVRVEFLAGKTTAKDRRPILAGLADGTVHIAVGTHALLTDTVTYHNLGVIIVDEQHRFGVNQRAQLRDRTMSTHGHTPDLLAMTATPIPRTAAMTIYGDLDLTILNELPPGRTPIHTTWIPDDVNLTNPTGHPWAAMRDQITQGRQGYVVCPLVEDSEKLQAASATDTYTQLSNGALTGLRVGLVHGQLPTAKKDATMAAFTTGDLDVLVATTVIEVGVNVPNATSIVILDAPRFGLAQLHQLRGRVGRAAHPSTCVLTGTTNTADATERMEAMTTTTNGFELAEIDARLRGFGAIYGTRQAGHDTGLRVGDLFTDLDLVTDAQTAANTILNQDPTLARSPILRAEVTTAITAEDAAALRRA